MIYGIGCDIVEIKRLEEDLARFGPEFAQKILHAVELKEFAKAKHPAVFLAKRFAAKEAAVKALGTGLRRGITLPQIATLHGDHGRPELAFHDEAKSLIEKENIYCSHISISDEKAYAMAFVVLEVK